MSGIVRGIVALLAGIVGLALGLGGLLAAGLVAVQPPGLGQAASPQDWEVTLEITDAFLTARLNEERGDAPIALRDAKAVSRADGTVTITGSLAPTGGGGAIGTPPAGFPRPPGNPPINFPGGPPGGPPINLPGNLPGTPPGNASGTPTVGGTTPTIAAEIILRPGSQNGKLTAAVDRAQLGPIPVPAQLGRLLEGPVNGQLANALNGQPFRVTAVTVRDGALVVRARREG